MIPNQKYTTQLEVEITLLYDYTREERQTRDNPYYPAEVDIHGMVIESVELTDEQFEAMWAKLPDETKQEWEQAILEHEHVREVEYAEMQAEAYAEQQAELREARRVTDRFFDFAASVVRVQEQLNARGE